MMLLRIVRLFGRHLLTPMCGGGIIPVSRNPAQGIGTVTFFVALLMTLSGGMITIARADEVDQLLANLRRDALRLNTVLQHRRIATGDSLLYPYELAFTTLSGAVIDTLQSEAANLSPTARSDLIASIDAGAYMQMDDAAATLSDNNNDSARGGKQTVGIIGKFKELLRSALNKGGWLGKIANKMLDFLDDQLKNIGDEFGPTSFGTVGVAPAGPTGPPGEEMQGAPNPFHSEVRLTIASAAAGAATIEVFDPQGRIVRTMRTTFKAPGTQVVSWDGRSEDGTEMKNGIYFISVKMGGAQIVWKSVLLK